MGLKEGLIAIFLAFLIYLGFIFYQNMNEKKAQNLFINQVIQIYNESEKINRPYIDSKIERLESISDEYNYFIKKKNNEIVYLFVYNHDYVIEIDGNDMKIPTDKLKVTDKLDSDSYRDSIDFKHRQLSNGIKIDESIIEDNNNKSVNDYSNIIIEDDEKKTSDKLTYVINSYSCEGDNSRRVKTYKKDNEFIVNIAMGKFDTDGYSVKVNKVIIDGENVKILVSETQAGYYSNNVVTNPCTMVSFNREPKSVSVLDNKVYNLKNSSERLYYVMSSPYECSIKKEGYTESINNNKYRITISSGNSGSYKINSANINNVNGDISIVINRKLNKNSYLSNKYNLITSS